MQRRDEASRRWSTRHRSVPAPLLLVLLVLALAVVVTSCGDDGGDADEGGGATAESSVPEVTVPPEAVDLTGRPAVTVEVQDNRYVPAAFRVDPGTEVTFTNVGLNDHNVTPVEEGTLAAVPTDDLEPGESASLTVGDAGTYGFYCTLHGTATRGQNGVVVVVPS